MSIPVYVVTGFLDAGKTTFLNDILNRHDWRQVKVLVIAFEAGEETLLLRHNNCTAISFSKKDLEQKAGQIGEEICNTVERCEPDEIWIEWNGVVPFSELQELLLQPSLRELCKVQKVIHIADGANIENLIGKTGAALPEQIANSDFAVVRNTPSSADYRRTRRLLNGINPGIDLYQSKASKDIYRQLILRRESPVNFFVFTILLMIALHLIAAPVFESMQIPFNTIINVFLGIILQAVPFLLIGVLLSSAIQIFVPQQWIERRFPKSLGLGMLVAILGGFCLPVCDCASIPVFRSLVKKGIPLPVAVTFMVASPVINPVVILSTYYAFSGNMTVVIGRVCLGIISAALIGFIMGLWPPKGSVLNGGALDRLMCRCGCYEDTESVTTFTGKLGLLLRHSQAEFFHVGKYLVIGTFVSAVFQTMGTGLFTSARSGAGLAVSIVIMMAMAFILSLCSSSDAVIARSFANQFPMGAIMGFLVFGPMMDIKNVMLLSSGFSKRFIGRLLSVTAVVCFAVVFLLSGLGVIKI